MLVQLTGLSGSGKTTIAQRAKKLLEAQQYKVEIIDGDIYRKTICRDLGFSKEDRCENIRRLAVAAQSFVEKNYIAIIAAINPFEVIRNELKEKYFAKTVWVKCDVGILFQRDTKGLYKRALLADDNPDKITNLTGINDIYDLPLSAELIIDTTKETPAQSAEKLFRFIHQQLNR